MKKTLLLVCVYFLFSSYKTITTNGYDDDSNYLKSSYNDLSFEARLAYHNNEMNALKNYYENFANRKEVADLYQMLLNNIVADARAQYDFMKKNNIDLDEMRQRPEELVRLSTSEMIKYQNNLRITEQKFAFTDEEVKNIDKLVNEVMLDASMSLNISLKLYQKYIHLANQIHYTKLEIIEDATGYKSPDALLSNSISSLDPNRPTRGLAANEAIRKLLDFGVDLSRNSSLIYPNPFTDNTTLKIFISKKGSLECKVYDVSGKMVKTLINTTEAPTYTELSWDGTDEAQNKLPNGVYFCIIKTEQGVESKKIVIQ